MTIIGALGRGARAIRANRVLDPAYTCSRVAQIAAITRGMYERSWMERVLRSWYVAVLAVAAVSLLCGCDRADTGGEPRYGGSGRASAAPAAETDELRVVVTIPPLAGLVEPMLPEGSAVTILIPPGAGMHTYSIPPRELASIARADVLVQVGASMEPAVDSFVREHGGEGLRRVVFSELDAVEDTHFHVCDDPSHHHDEDLADPHLWLDPGLAVYMVEAVADALTDAVISDSEAVAGIIEKRDALIAQIESLDVSFRERLSGKQRDHIVVAHNAWSRLADRYGFVTVPLAGVLAQEPTPRDIKRASDVIGEHGVPVIFTEPQLSAAAARRVAEIAGVELRQLDPLGSGDYIGLMRSNLGAIADALGCPGAEAGVVAGGKNQAP